MGAGHYIPGYSSHGQSHIQKCISEHPSDFTLMAPVRLVTGVLDMGNELGPFSGKVISSSEEVSGISHFRRIDICHRHYA